MKKLIIIIFGIFLISGIYGLTAGECDTIIFPNDKTVEMSVIGNSSDIIGLNWTKNGTLITYCFDLNYVPDNFTIRFFNYQEVSTSSGGSSSSYVWRAGIHGGQIIPKINETISNEKEDLPELIDETEKTKESSNSWLYMVLGIVFVIIILIAIIIKMKGGSENE